MATECHLLPVEFKYEDEHKNPPSKHSHHYLGSNGS